MKPRKTLRIEGLEARTMLTTDVGLPVDLDGLDETVDPPAIDGTENNETNPEWGSTDEALLRITTAEYSDGLSEPAGTDAPSARAVSNAVAAQSESVVNDRGLTDLLWLWGQFVDHDIDLTENADPAEPLPIEVPSGDIFFDPASEGDRTIDFNRSIYEEDADGVRQQINQITAFLDGSVVYGSDQDRADELRTFEGGQLKTSEGDLLPFNEAGLANAGGTSDSLFLAGDVRANENAALSAMQTLWVREHNRLADEIAAENPELTDEDIYQEARSIVTAEIQAITFNEFLPALLGEGAISGYEGYDATVNPGITNLFSTAAYRFGHSMLSSELLRLNDDGTVADEGNLSLASAFFAPNEIIDNGIESVLLGAASQEAQEIDTMIVDDVRNFLFGAPGADGFDLASLNIQRGRDHGLADYNQVREDLGLERAETFADITSDVELQQALEDVYGDVDSIDVWVGALAEDHVSGSSVGELVQTVLVDQFERIRDGDSNWYQNSFDGRELRAIEQTTLADVIERNSDVSGLQENVFFTAAAQPETGDPGPRGPMDGGNGPRQGELPQNGPGQDGRRRNGPGQDDPTQLAPSNEGPPQLTQPSDGPPQLAPRNGGPGGGERSDIDPQRVRALASIDDPLAMEGDDLSPEEPQEVADAGGQAQNRREENDNDRDGRRRRRARPPADDAIQIARDDAGPRDRDAIAADLAFRAMQLDGLL